MGNIKKAIEFLEQAIELDNNADIYNELGICLYGLGEIEGAIEVFSNGIRINPPMDYKIIFNRAMLNLELGNIHEAIEDINLAYELNPKEELIKEQKKFNWKNI